MGKKETEITSGTAEVRPDWSQASAPFLFLSLVLPRIVLVKEIRLARPPASSQWRKGRGRRHKKEEGTKCKFDQQTISFLGSGV